MGSLPIDALRQIDIFDSDEATHYLRGESTASYTPPVVGLFEKPAVATDKIKELLQAEQAKLTSALPAIPAIYQQTQLAQTYAALHTLRKAGDLDKLLEWTDHHTQSLDALVKRLKADDPDTLSKQKHRTKTQVEQIIYAGTSGQPADQEVWNNNTKKANNILLTRLKSAHEASEAGGAAAYRALAQGICSDFRKLVERSVEEDLLNKVVLRHRRSVTTEGRLAQLHGILPDECKLIDDLMTRYSCFEHSQSGEAPVIIPEADALKADIESLVKWRKELNERRAQLAVA